MPKLLVPCHKEWYAYIIDLGTMYIKMVNAYTLIKIKRISPFLEV